MPQTQTEVSAEITPVIEKILRATLTCVASQGYEGATTKTIAEAAGVSKGLLHYHFKTKEDLLIATLEFFADDIRCEVEKVINLAEPQPSQVMTALDKLYEQLFNNKERIAFLLQIYSTAVYNKRVHEKLNAYRLKEKGLIESIAYPLLKPFEALLPLSSDRLIVLFQTMLVGLSGIATAEAEPERVRQIYQDIRVLVIQSVMSPIMFATRGHEQPS